MVPFDDFDDEQRISIANDHPNDLDSGPSSPSSVLPSYLRHRRQSKSTSRHRSHTTTEGSTSHLLARLIARDDEVREINALLVVTSERLETESNRANSSERRALEYFNRLRQATEGRDRSEQEAARLREELNLYKVQLENAQKEIFRAQDIINQVSAQKSEAEAEAARARTKVRQLHEEKMVMIAHEEGRHRGYNEGLSYARRFGFNQGRSRPIRPSESSVRRMPRRAVPPDGEDEEDEEEQDESVHSERNNVPFPPRASTGHPRHVRPDSAPPVPVPALVTPIPPPSSSHEPPPRRIRTPTPPTPEGTTYPIPMRSAHSSGSRRSVNVPQDGWIPQADPHTSYIQMPPPHDLSQPVPPGRSSHSHELDNYPPQTTVADEDASYALVRTRDFAYTQPAALPVPRPRTPSLISKSSSTHMSQYELVSAPTERRHTSSLRHELSSMYTRSGSQPERHMSSRGGYGNERSREELVQQWRADPEVVATATPGTAIRDFEMIQSGSDYPRELIMPADLADIYPSSRTEAQPPPVTFQQKSPPRLRNAIDYFRHRFQRTQSNASVPDITVQSPSETASTQSEHAHQPRPELLSPESAHRSLPPTHEEHPRTSGSHFGDTLDSYRSTTPQPQWPAEFITIPGAPSSSLERDSQYSRSRSRGPDERYQMSPIPEGIMYPDTPLRAQSSHGRRRSKESLSSSPAPLERPISLFSDQDEVPHQQNRPDPERHGSIRKDSHDYYQPAS